MMKLAEVCDAVFRDASKGGAEDVSVLGARVDEDMIRFSNNTVTVVKRIRNLSVMVYLGQNKRRILAETSNPEPMALKTFVNGLYRACKYLRPSVDYTSLPKGPFTFRRQRNCDRRISESEPAVFVEYVRQAIDLAQRNGASRVSGTLSAATRLSSILTSGGASGGDRLTEITLNLRAFSETGASGHGLSCAVKISEFSPSDAALTAAQYAEESSSRGPWEVGRYDLILSPTVTADIIQHVGHAASAFNVEAGMSFLAQKIGERVGAESLTIADSGMVPGGVNSRIFDDEGYPTGDNVILDKGVLRGYLHNSTTAGKFRSPLTGNAGIIAPQPWNLVVDGGDQSHREMVESTRRGIIITNNWYTRFQNMAAGEYSTLPRDAAFLVENGRIKYAVSGMRVSDSIPRQLQSISAISPDRRWIKWWEVETPTLAPWILVRDVPVTKPLG